MEYKPLVTSLDDLSTPVIMCDSNGLVIYKNEAAIKDVRLPRRNTHMQPHLQPWDERRLAEAGEVKKPFTVSVNTGDRKACALVCGYDRQAGGTCTLWIFPALLQINSSTRYGYFIENELIGAADDLARTIKAIDEKSFHTEPEKREAADNRIKKYISGVIGYMFGSDPAPYPLAKGIRMIAEAMNRTFVRFGYDVQIDVSGALDTCKQEKYLDLKSFAVFFFHLITFFAECDTEHSMSARFCIEKDIMNIDLLFSMPYPPFYTECDGDLSKLISLAPSNVLDVLIFERFAKRHGYGISFTIGQAHADNVTVRTSVPLTADVEFRDRQLITQTEEVLLECDIREMYYYMMKFRDKNV